MRWSSDSAVTASILFVCARCKCVLLVVTYQTKWFYLLKHSHIAVHNKSGSADALKPSRWWSVCRWDICVWKKHKSALKKECSQNQNLWFCAHYYVNLIVYRETHPRRPDPPILPSFSDIWSLLHEVLCDTVMNLSSLGIFIQKHSSFMIALMFLSAYVHCEV